MSAVAPRAAGALGALERVQSLAAGLLARDRWPRAQLLAYQRNELRGLLEYASGASAYYREALGADAAARALGELPTLSKATLVEQWDRIVTDPSLRLKAVEAHAVSAAGAEPYLGAFRVVCTSGSSGLRGVFVFAPREWEAWIAAHLRLFRRIGIDPKMRLATIGAPGSMHLTRQLFDDFGADRTGVPRLSVLTPVGEIVQALNAYRPQALLGYPSIGAVLADEQLAGRLRIKPRVAGFGGEPLTREIRERVEAAWGIAPANLYASTEAPIIAASSPAHPDALELGEDTLIAEVVDERNRPVAPGEVGSKLLITSLLSRTLPLIRYELSDRVTLATGPNPAGRPYRTIASIDGRAADTLRLPASSGGEIELLPHYLTAPIARTAGVQQYQILWDGQRLELCVVLGATASPDTTTRLGAELTRALGAAGVLNPAIHVRTVAELQREPGPAAKLKLIKSTVGER